MEQSWAEFLAHWLSSPVSCLSVPAKESEGLGGRELERLERMEAWSRTLHGEREIAKQLYQ